MTQTQETKTTRTGMRPWLKGVLFASLAMNLAVVGIIAGAAWKFAPGKDGRHPPRLDMVVGPYTHALSREDRRAIGKQMREAYRSQRPSREEIRAEFANVLAALRATPYDATKVETILMSQLQGGMERQELGQRMLIDRLAAMSDSERAGFADRLEEGLKKHRDDHKKDWKKDRD
ncbi:MAG: periplasmic heavy metal sensor [Thalassovita sp.]